MSWIATGAAIASAVVSAGAAIYTGQKQKEALEYNAKVAENQAEVEQLEAREAMRRKRDENKAFMARQLSMQAKAGGSIQSGSSLLVAAESAARLEMEALEMSRSSRNRQYELKTSADMMRKRGRQVVTASYMQAGSSLLAGASNAYSTYNANN